MSDTNDTKLQVIAALVGVDINNEEVAKRSNGLQARLEDYSKRDGAEEAMAKKLKALFETLNKKVVKLLELKKDQAKLIVAYRKAVGKEVWESVGSNPSLSQMMQIFIQDQTKLEFAKTASQLSKVYPASCGFDELDCKLILVVFMVASIYPEMITGTP